MSSPPTRGGEPRRGGGVESEAETPKERATILLSETKLKNTLKKYLE